MNNSKRIFLIILLVILSMVVVACSGKSDGEETSDSQKAYKIGAIVSKTGSANAMGEPQFNALEMLVDKINSDGGINGIPIELSIVDDETNQDKAVQQMQRLINDEEVLAVLGSTLSGPSLAMKGIAVDTQTPMISFASADEIVDPDDPATKWVFKAPHSNSQAVGKTIQYLLDEGLTKVAFIHDTTSYGEGAYREFEDLAKQNSINIVANESFNNGDADMSAQLISIKSKNPDAVIVWGISNESATVAKNMKSLKMDAPLIGSYGIANEGFLKVAGEAAEGMVIQTGKLLFPEQISNDDVQYNIISQFNEEYQNKYNSEPTNFASYAYDGLYMIVEAIKNGATDREAIRDYLENDIVNWVGATGTYTITDKDHVGLKADSLVMAEVKNGEWVIKE